MTAPPAWSVALSVLTTAHSACVPLANSDAKSPDCVVTGMCGRHAVAPENEDALLKERSKRSDREKSPRLTALEQRAEAAQQRRDRGRGGCDARRQPVPDAEDILPAVDPGS